MGLGIAAWFAAFVALVVWRLLSGAIATSGLLLGVRRDGATYFSPARLQLLLVTLVLAASLVRQIAADPARFPHVPPWFLAGLIVSQAAYLIAKARALRR